MARNPNAAPPAGPPPAPETQERSRPGIYNFSTALGGVEATGPFQSVGNNVFIAAHEVNTMPDFATGSKLQSVKDIETFMPGTEELVEYAKEGREPKPEEEAFLDAMKWKAEFWHEKAKREPIEASDYDNDENPLAYSEAMDAAIRKLANKALAKKAEADKHGNAALAERHQLAADGLERYRQFFNPQPDEEQFTPNQHLAKEYLVAAKELTGATPKHKKMMEDQAEYDRIYATYNSAIKKEMRDALDTKEAEEVRKSKTYIDNQLSSGLARKYKKKQRGAGFRKVSVDQKNHDKFDNEVVELVDREARIRARKERDNGKKFEGDDLDDFLATRTNAVYDGLGKKTAEKHKGKWNFSWKKTKLEGLPRAILNAVTGRDLEGTQVKKGWQKRAKLGFNALKITGVIAGGMMTGGAGYIVAGGLIGASHWYMKREAKAGAERVANVGGGIPKEEALKLAIKSISGSRLDKIRAANKLNKESNEKYTKELRTKRAGRIMGASAIALVSVATPTLGLDDWAFDRLHDVTGAISDEWHSWGDAWSVDQSSAPSPQFPEWYYQSYDELSRPS